jgi:hypothetical protein
MTPALKVIAAFLVWDSIKDCKKNFKDGKGSNFSNKRQRVRKYSFQHPASTPLKYPTSTSRFRIASFVTARL